MRTVQAGAVETEFTEEGFLGPVPVLEPGEAVRLSRRLGKVPGAEWQKGLAAASPEYFAVATHPVILERVSAILGDDVMLWGVTRIVRKPGQVHPWHTDMETAEGAGRTVSVWLGLENVNSNSSLQLIPYSHRFGITIQELRERKGTARDRVSADEVLAWALERDPRSVVMRCEMGNGDAVLFDGRLWHGTDNTNRRGVRTALLIQYATPDRAIRIPDYSHLDWPFRFHEEPLPPCIMVRGTDVHGVNRMVPPPSGTGDPQSWIEPLDLPLAEDPESGWKAHPIRAGSTRMLSRMTCHASVLSAGHTPHEPHEHPEEEILIVLGGEATLMIGPEGDIETQRAGRGDFVYYPARRLHTITNDSGAPITYLMFKWRGPEVRSEDGRLATSLHRRPAATGGGEPGGTPDWKVRNVLDGPTDYLRKLHVHVSTLQPGAGYEPHVDGYDVALVVLEGTVETLGRRVGPNGVVFYAAGEPHGMRNAGEEAATYVVFEFHGSAPTGGGRPEGRLARLRKRIRRIAPRRIRKPVSKALQAFRRGGRPRSP